MIPRWWSHHLETEASSFETPFGGDRRKRIWKLLARSEELDKFLGKKFPNLKRYGTSHLNPRLFSDYGADHVGCEGAESMLPALDTLFEVSAKGKSSSRHNISTLKVLMASSWDFRCGPLPPSPWSTLTSMRPRSYGILTYRPLFQDQGEPRVRSGNGTRRDRRCDISSFRNERD